MTLTRSKRWRVLNWKASSQRGGFLPRIYALHVAVEEHAQAIAKLGKATLREAVEFFLPHNRLDVVRLTLAEVADHFAKSREQ